MIKRFLTGRRQVWNPEAIAKIVSLLGLVSLIAFRVDGQKNTVALTTPDYPVFLTPSLRHGLDTTVSPCVDFDRFVNGGWRAAAVLPDSVNRFGIFNATMRQTELLFGEILESARTSTAEQSDPRLKVLGQYYESCLRIDTLPKNVQGLSMHRALKQDSSRAARCRRLAMQQLPDAMGQVFVNTILTPETDARLQLMIGDIRTEVVKRVTALTYVSSDAKARTLDALKYMTFNIAKPTDTVDYAGLTLSDMDFVTNQKTVKEYLWKYRMTSNTGQPKVPWLGNQYTPNAHFNPENNSIEIPTFIFQWPFFDPNDPTLSYASAGVVLGHEVLHGVTWKLTSEGTASSVFERGKVLGPQYASLPPIDSVPVNGKNTVNENLADLGGVLMSYDAWSHSHRPAAVSLVDGFTPEQRVFVHYARLWRSKATRAWRQQQAGMDPHAPEPARINGVVMNVPAFAKAFGCKEGDPMARSEAQRAKIW